MAGNQEKDLADTMPFEEVSSECWAILNIDRVLSDCNHSLEAILLLEISYLESVGFSTGLWDPLAFIAVGFLLALSIYLLP